MYAAVLAESLGLSLLYLRWLDRGRRGTLVAYALLANDCALHALLRRVADGRPRRPRPLAGPRQPARCRALVGGAPPRRAGGDRRRVRPVGDRPGAGLPRHLAGRVRTLRPHGACAVADGDRAGTRGARPPAGRRGARCRLRRAARARSSRRRSPGCVPIVFGAFALRRDRGGRAFVGTAVLVPLALVLLACVRWPLVHEKYLIFLAPFLLYLAVARRPLGAGAPEAGPPRRPRRAARRRPPRLPRARRRSLRPPERRSPVRQGGVARGPRVRRAAGAEGRRRPPPRALHADDLGFYDQDRLVPASPVPTLDLPCDHPTTAAELLAAFPALSKAKRVFLVSSHEATEGRDDTRDAVVEALYATWGELSTHQTDFPRQWGIRVFRFSGG